jgi:hypothetical protein
VKKVNGDVGLHAAEFKQLSGYCATFARTAAPAAKAILKAKDPLRLQTNPAVRENIKRMVSDVAESLLHSFWPSVLWLYAAHMGEWKTPFHVTRNEAAKRKCALHMRRLLLLSSSLIFLTFIHTCV